MNSLKKIGFCTFVMIMSLTSSQSQTEKAAEVEAETKDEKSTADLKYGEAIWTTADIKDKTMTRVEFPDLAFYKGYWYCSFRESTLHQNHPSGRGRVIRSADGVKWETAALFEWNGGDVRDPRLSITADGNLMVNASIFFISEQPRETERHHFLTEDGTPATQTETGGVARQSVTWFSSNGTDWTTASADQSGINNWRWDVTWHGGMAYSAAYGGSAPAGTLFRSRDGKFWQVLVEKFFPEGKGNESSIAFGPDDTAYSILRGARNRLMLGVGKAPLYTEWEWSDVTIDYSAVGGGTGPSDEMLTVAFGGPRLLRLSNGKILAAGRVGWKGGKQTRVTLFWLDPATRTLTKWFECKGSSYPGIVEHDGMIWVSHSSQDNTKVMMVKVKLP